jgi:class 3 adenylate cyclase/tetratricopeptide (TPR) repeat protein
MARAETITILFTDLVSSTELLQQAGDDAAQHMFAAHHDLLSASVREHGGHEVKWLGDGLMVTFDAAADALRCAIAMQQHARRATPGARLEIRVGLHTGDALRSGEDLFGTPVVIARRLCDTADAGQILTTDTLLNLVQDQSSFNFENLGRRVLKGIREQVEVVEVQYEHEPLSLLALTPFVGRGDVLAALSKKLDGAVAGRGSLVMLVGEPGIGKTRTASEFAARARRASATVLRGSCYDGDWAPPFSPFVEAIRAYAATAPPEELAARLGAGAGILARIVPLLRERLPGIEEPPPVPAEGERYRLLDAAGEFFARMTEGSPVVLLLDDLHWADKGTIAMLRQVARVAGDHALLMVGAYRDVELDRTHPLAEALADLRRQTNYERIVLRGLAALDVGELLGLVAEQDVPETFTRAISEETGGNPFFIREVMLHLVEDGKIVLSDGRWVGAVSIAEMRIPEGVKEVIGRRLSRLSPTCGQMLSVASALTAGFTWDLIAALVEADEGALLDAVDEAVGAQLIVEREKGQYDFAHALIRHTLYEELNTPRRLLLHRRIGGVLENLYSSSIEEHLSELAYHFSEAGLDDAGVDYCRRAALRSVTFGAYEDALGFIDRALTLNSDPRTRYELLLMLGRVQFYAGRMDFSNLDAFVEAAGIARELGDKDLLARAAICDGRYWPHGDPRFKPLLKEALDALGEEETPLRAMTQAIYANHAGYDIGMGVLGFQEVAVDVARRSGDSRATALVLMYQFLLRNLINEFITPAIDGLDAALAMLPEAEASGDPELKRAARIACYWALIKMGRIDEIDAHMLVHRELTDASRIPADVNVTDACTGGMALLRGDFHIVEGLQGPAERAYEQGVFMAIPNYLCQLVVTRILQGRAREAQALFRNAAVLDLSDAVWQIPGMLYLRQSLQLMVSTALEDRDATADMLAAYVPPVDNALMRTYVAGQFVVVPDACLLTDNRDEAAGLYSRMLPWAHQNIGFTLYTLVGSGARGLGLLATVLERFDDAAQHFEDALEMNTRMGARPWVVRTQLDYVRMLLKQGEPKDRPRIQELLEAAQQEARMLGMAKAVADSAELLAQA